MWSSKHHIIIVLVYSDIMMVMNYIDIFPLNFNWLVSYPKHGSLLLFRLVFDVVTINGRISRHCSLIEPKVRIPATDDWPLSRKKNWFLFFFFLVYIEMSLHSFPFFLDLSLLTNMYSLTHCLVARAALTLVFSTRLLLRSFFSSPRITDTYLDRSHVYPLDR